MIYVATVHWMNDKWITPQRRALESHLKGDYRVFANLEGIDGSFDSQFYYVEHGGGTHPDKLNRLSAAIALEASRSDKIVFLDGDAFPIREVGDWLDKLLDQHYLAAVRRKENAGDLQPHPCFCVTTVGFWSDLGGDWSSGGSWTNERGKMTSDVGGQLLLTLNKHELAWREILRSNKKDFHPLFFGVYEDHIYHHGAGFRIPISRVDHGTVPIVMSKDYLSVRENARSKNLMHLRPKHVPKLIRAIRQAIGSRGLNDHIRSIQKQSDCIFQKLCADPEFFLMFEGEEP